ncbi:MAG TPA: hypothetical protein VKM55_16960 [Candidatus Lokiarchaeia archaeon]|nr:hypothetical protein [Candidatus Lokiarchaeia archaeon]
MTTRKFNMTLFCSGITIIVVSPFIMLAGAGQTSPPQPVHDIIYWFGIAFVYLGIILIIIPARESERDEEMIGFNEISGGKARRKNWIELLIFATALGTSICAAIGGFFMRYMIDPGTGRAFPWIQDPYSIMEFTPLCFLISIFTFLGGAWVHIFGKPSNKNTKVSTWPSDSNSQTEVPEHPVEQKFPFHDSSAVFKFHRHYSRARRRRARVDHQ